MKRLPTVIFEQSLMTMQWSLCLSVTVIDVRALLSRMLSWEPRRRPTMDKVLRDPIFQHLVRPGDVSQDGPLDEQVSLRRLVLELR